MMNCIISRLFTPITYQVNPDCQELTEFVRSVPDRFHRQEGVVIYRGRNELRKMTYQEQDFVVKSFRRPNCINRWVYGTFRPSKARRSFEHANLLTAAGIGTPRPIGYIELRRHWEFDESYYITAMSSCPYTYEELFRRPFANEDDIIRAVALTTARMHDQGYAHKDYGRGNILFNPKPDGVQIEIVDLNRMDIGPIDRLLRTCTGSWRRRMPKPADWMKKRVINGWLPTGVRNRVKSTISINQKHNENHSCSCYL